MEYTVTNEGKRMSGARIQVFQNGHVIDDVKTDAKGRADILLKPNGVYTITVTGIGLVTKKLEVNTNNMGSEEGKAYYYPAEVEIFPKIEGLNYSILDKPIGKIAFDPEFGDFSADANHTKSMQSALKKLTSDYLAKKEAEAEREKEKQKEYDAAIKIADKAFSDEEWEKAEQEYKKAAALMPLESYPTFQLAELETKLIKIRETNKKYNDAIAAAEAAEASDDLATAIAEYQRASGYKPDEEAPKVKIKSLQARIANEAKAEQDYLAAIEKGDNALKANDLNTAKSAFEEASQHKPNESYPKNKLAEINDILSKREAKEQEYNTAIKAGDDALAASEFEKAKTHYQSALSIKPGEQYPTDQIAKVEGMMAEEAKKQQDYLAAIEQGDQALAANKYEEAKTAFQSASQIKPTEDYPKNKIKEIDQFLADAQAKEKEYLEKVKIADKALAAEDYDAAKNAYTEAAKLKPTEQYPKDKLKEIDGVLADLAAKDEQYNTAISNGDQAMASQDYEGAKQAFNEALSIKPNEQYPKDKLGEIETIVLDLQKQNEEYQSAITEGDQALAKSNYEGAKAAYLKASGLKPTEQYPQDKLKEIDGLVAAEAEKEKNYADAVEEGDAAFGVEDLDKAEAAYAKALSFKPEETYPQSQLAEIDKKREELKAAEEAAAKLEADYQTAIKDGDAKFASEDFKGAREAYNAALSLKAKEQYPKDQLAAVDAKEKELAEAAAAAEQLEADYQAAIKEGDQKFAAEDLEGAKSAYTKAGDLKPEETYPKDQLAAIQTKENELAEAKAAAEKLEADYQAAISKADAALSKQSLEEALNAYTEASHLKPEEQYPKDKIKEVEELKLKLEAEKAEEERLAQLQKDYDALIAKADAAYSEGNLEAARSDYQSALTLKSEESYPKGKIEEINTTLADAAEQEEAYGEAIGKADELMASESFEEAKSKYQEASSIKPNEQYPKDKISEIDAKLSELAAKEEEIRLQQEAAEKLQADYEAAVKEGDDAFNANDLDKAETAYGKALSLKPEETYPQSQLAAIDTKRAELSAAEQQAAIDQKYQALIQEADEFFNNQDFGNAKAKYIEASAVKPEESYPNEQLVAIDNKASELAAAEQAAKLDEDYNTAIAEGDQAFNSADYDVAEKAYLKALSLKPAETYPQSQLGLIDDKKAEIALQQQEEAAAAEEAARLAKLDEDYNAAIAEGDQAFNSNDYDTAEKAYLKALSLKPAETYPQSQLGLIDDKKAEIALQQQEEAAAAEEAARLAKLEQDYLMALEKGDQALAANQLNDALTAFREASTVKPDEDYPKNKIAEIEALIETNKAAEEEALAERNAKYQELIVSADNAFSSKAWEQARSRYQEAQTYKPSESYPSDQIAEIDRILAEKAAKEEERRLAREREARNAEAYQTAIAEGDQAFNNGSYSEAKNKYELALGLKPSEEYPTNKIAEIDAIIAEQAAALAAEEAEKQAAKQRETNYARLISEGDANFSKSAYSAAKGSFTQALKIKPDETYPKEQLRLIEAELEKLRLAREEELKRLDEPIKIKEGPRSSIDGSAEAEIDRIYKEMWDKRNSDKNDVIVKAQEKYVDIQRENNERGEERRLEALKKLEDVSVSMTLTPEESEQYYMQNHEAILDKEKAIADARQELERNAERERNEAYEDEGDLAKQIREYNKNRNEEITEGKKEKVEEEIAEVIEQEKENASDHHEKILEAKENNEQKLEDIITFNQERAEEQLNENRDLPATQLKDWQETNKGYTEEGIDRTLDNQAKIDDKQVEVRQFQQERNDHFKENQERIEEKVEDLLEENQRLESKAESKRQENSDEEFYQGEDKPRQDRMAEKYPQGVTEEIIENKNNSTTIRRIVVNGTEVDIYEKTLYSWGGVFYTKNGSNISKEDWDANSK